MENIKMNLTIVACLCIAIFGIFALKSDRAVFPFIMECSISFGIQILPLTRMLRLDDIVKYAQRKINQIVLRIKYFLN